MSDVRPELVVIRRRSALDDPAPKSGGVWKIAYADFMTAMMCFFLVMWLINAANEQTKAAVASYFNPVKLVDRNASRKGLEDLGNGPSAAGQSSSDPQEKTSKSGQDESGASGTAEFSITSCDSLRRKSQRRDGEHGADRLLAARKPDSGRTHRGPGRRSGDVGK